MTQGILTTSDRRVKDNITESDPDNDLSSLLRIPVHRYNFIDRHDRQTTIGFIAQEVESILPCATKTTGNSVPNILAYLAYERTIDEHQLVCTPENVDVINKIVSNVYVGCELKFVVDDCEYIREVKHVSADGCIISLNEDQDDFAIADENVFVYGTIVRDFKLIDSERLIPLAFNSIKALTTKITRQEQIIESLLKRLSAIESKVQFID
jgi:hypothetical protein